MMFIDTPAGALFFGYISETAAIMIFGIGLVVATIVLRWLLNKYEAVKAKDEMESER